ncbi:hypothetical protein AUC68_09880 [Methyloceanibacter methanicus]|uniref:Uncharacterized protein n=1 Tax=Methyloceanibacter methanicus TaxID=1774968 RepID=A0A1E3VYS2_9HYPH|nr:hypothetical protein [Methyloceanibacter methanicus]ODR98688.1 hypothetical protein AUC68_09880 [Methyloceanibacter methanicus]
MAAVTKSGGSKRGGGAKARSAEAKEPDATREEVADYIASMLTSLRLLAHRKDMALLAYLIGVALEEANAQKAGQD